MFVSWNASAALMRFQAIELEVLRNPPSVLPEAREQFAGGGLAGDLQHARSGHVDLYLLAFLQLQRLHHRGGKPHGKAVTPLCDLHTAGRSLGPDGYTSFARISFDPRQHKVRDRYQEIISSKLASANGTPSRLAASTRASPT